MEQEQIRPTSADADEDEGGAARCETGLAPEFRIPLPSYELASLV